MRVTFFKSIDTPFNACCQRFCLCSICIQEGKHITGKKKIERCGSFFLLLYIRVFVEGVTRMLCDHLNPRHEMWIDIICTYSVICYTYRYIFDVLFLTTRLRCENVHISFFPPRGSLYTAQASAMPFPFTVPVVIVHPVLFCQSFMDVSLNCPHNSGGCSQMCEL